MKMRRPTDLPTAPGGDLRAALRHATQDVHQRLHHHPGFSALQSGAIGLAQYRSLLVRLFGFYAPLEAQAGLVPNRTQWLLHDLGLLQEPALGFPSAALQDLPRCTMLPRCDTPARRIGARYVIEGATLGGQHLARRLDALLGAEPADGAAANVASARQFFTGFGAGTGANWRGFLVELARLPSAGVDHAAAIAAAQETFAVFEHWLMNWEAA